VSSTDRSGDDQADGNELQRRDVLAEGEHADDRGAARTEPGPDRVRGTDVQLTECRGEQHEADQRACGEPDAWPQSRQPVALLEQHRKTPQPAACRGRGLPRGAVR